MYEQYPAQAMADSAAYSPIPMFFWAIALAFYVYFAFMQYKLAHITGPSKDAWWAFIPIMNTILLINMARKPMWWLALLFIPIVNVVAFFMLWHATAVNAGKSGFWGILVMVPFINVVAMFVLAFGNRPYEYPADVTPGPASPGPDQRPKQPSQVG